RRERLVRLRLRERRKKVDEVLPVTDRARDEDAGGRDRDRVRLPLAAGLDAAGPDARDGTVPGPHHEGPRRCDGPQLDHEGPSGRASSSVTILRLDSSVSRRAARPSWSRWRSMFSFARTSPCTTLSLISTARRWRCRRSSKTAVPETRSGN